MTKSLCRLAGKLLLLSLLVCGLGACSKSEEHAEEKSAQTGPVESSPRPTALKETAPEVEKPTESAKMEPSKQPPLPQEQIRQLKRQAFASLESVQKVVIGYHSVYHRWPASIKDIDDGEYFFDSNYMAESVTDGYEVYLALEGDAGYQLWSFPQQARVGFQLNPQRRGVIDLERTAALKQIEARYRVEAEKGKLVFLVPRG